MNKRNWPLFQPPKKPIVIDFFGWMEDPWAKALRERADKGKGWARYWSTKPCLDIPKEPDPVPFRKSLLHYAIINIITAKPMFVEAAYVEQAIDLSLGDDTRSSLYKVLEDMWDKYMESEPGAMDCRRDKFGNPIVDPSLRIQWVDPTT